MVLLHYKITEHNQFLYETTLSEQVDQTIKNLIEINNLRIIIDRLAVAVEDLATYGIMKPEELRGLSDEDTIKYAMETMPKDKLKWAQKPVPGPGERFNQDKTHYRYGVIKGEDITKMMIETATNAKKSISKNLVSEGKILLAKDLKEEINKLRGAVMIAYPGYHGLPEWEPALLILENKHTWEGQSTDIGDYLNEKDTSLWWAGKELQKGKALKDFIGKNEKTKVVVKITKSGSGAPAREPMIDEETYKKMLSYYHKKQEETKQLEEDNDDHYMDSAWANPSQLKNQLQGNTENVSWKPNLKKF